MLYGALLRGTGQSAEPHIPESPLSSMRTDLSIVDPEYKGLDEGHQIIGIVVVAALLLQATLGYVHHTKYKALGRKHEPAMHICGQGES